LHRLRGRPLANSSSAARRWPVEPKTITLQGGVAGGVNEVGSALVPAADGNTLSKTPLTIPGGLIGIELDGITEVTATAELAGPVILDLPNLGTNNPALTMPLKVKLDNPLLLNSCYVGSDTEPVTLLQLTTGTSGSITGSKGTVHVLDHNKIIEVAGSSLVDTRSRRRGPMGAVARWRSWSIPSSISTRACLRGRDRTRRSSPAASSLRRRG